MSPTLNPIDITYGKFAEILSRYSATITAVSVANPAPKAISKNTPVGAQMTLEDLDSWRLCSIQRTLESREKPFLTKDETEMLLACKMKRGKHRAALPKLLAANSPELIRSATASAFTCLTSTGVTPPSTETILNALKILVDAIKGVGPATASYILALGDPASVPVFSDEGYRWVLYTNTGERDDGWDRKIKYDIKEYKIYLDAVKTLVERLDSGVTAQDVERVGFVLGKEAAGHVGRDKATKARIMLAKKPTGADAFDAGLKVAETNNVSVPPSPSIGVQVIGLPASNLTRSISSAAGLPTQSPAFNTRLNTKKARTISKRKKVDSDENDGDSDDIPLPQHGKARTNPAAKKNKKKQLLKGS